MQDNVLSKDTQHIIWLDHDSEFGGYNKYQETYRRAWLVHLWEQEKKSR